MVDRVGVHHIGGTLRDENVTLVLPANELVDHQCFETVADRVDVADPLGPAQHITRRDSETCIDDKTQNEDGGRRESLDERLG